MTLQELVGEFIGRRSTGGLFLEDHEVLACAVAATRRYLAYGSLESAPELSALDAVDGSTAVTPGEWGVICPLFELMAEKESALRVESSRGLGVDVPGRSADSVEQDIQQVLRDLPQLAFSADCVSVGYDD